ncbi:anti-sigma factor [Kitasatospora sp. NPDC001603]|uniref:anti-sigma factor n=1 Tax=Kitasatospora sp. NPDC001603 TaxID=3154388 RepID=UPI00332F3CDD
MTTPADADPHLHTGAYALNALDPDEHEAFEAHLDGCDTCAVEVAGFATALARLGAADRLRPPPALRARVMARLDDEQQLPPLHRDTRAAPRPHRPRGSARWPRFALAASLAAATALGALSVQQHDQAQQARAETEQLRTRQAAFGELLTAPDARVTSTNATNGTDGTGTLVWSTSRNLAGFLASGLPDPGPGRVYELWLDRAGTLSPAGLLPDGDGALVLTAPLDGARAVALTQEPAGGSAQPTGEPLMALRLPPTHPA